MKIEQKPRIRIDIFTDAMDTYRMHAISMKSSCGLVPFFFAFFSTLIILAGWII
jgi:hypothetical protein